MKKTYLQNFSFIALSAAFLGLGSCSNDSAESIDTDSMNPSATSFELAHNENDFVQLSGQKGAFENGLKTTTAPGDDRGRYNISLRYLVPPTERQQDVFESAAARWERIIIKDVPSITGTIPSAFSGVPPIIENGTIDDIVIEVVIAPIDGPGNILGQAGPRFTRNSDGLTVTGLMFFDVADLETLDGLDLFENVIVHEMGHVLGIGTLWESKGLLAGTSAEPYFAGRKANVFWNAEGGVGELPIENTGGPGTAYGHWRESILRNELMTGYINLGENPLSRITAGSLKDLGYGAASVGETYDIVKGAPGVDLDELNTTSKEGLYIAKMEEVLLPIGVIEDN